MSALTSFSSKGMANLPLTFTLENKYSNSRLQVPMLSSQPTLISLSFVAASRTTCIELRFFTFRSISASMHGSRANPLPANGMLKNAIALSTGLIQLPSGALRNKVIRVSFKISQIPMRAALFVTVLFL